MVFETTELFEAGQGGYFCYRIPALAITELGAILAFCEGRKFSCGDSDQIDLLVRRSTDGGRTFSPQQVVATQDGWVCGNPAPVVERTTGAIFLPFCKNLQNGNEAMIIEGNAPRTVWLTRSDDQGMSWSDPRDITTQAKLTDWSWYATGPGHGIQLAGGRLIVPCDHIIKNELIHSDPYHSHVIYSDDRGGNWHIGGSTDEGTNESTILESSDGQLYLNCRNKAGYQLPEGGQFRAVAWSRDGGESFSPIVHDAALPEPICQASVCRGPSFNGKPTALFSNPASRDGRKNMTVRVSADECRSWPVGRVIHTGPAAYSDLGVTQSGAVCCF